LGAIKKAELAAFVDVKAKTKIILIANDKLHRIWNRKKLDAMLVAW
jgi:hypothetical protein